MFLFQKDIIYGIPHKFEMDLRRDGECVGYVRSTAYGHTIKSSIAYGYVDCPRLVAFAGESSDYDLDLLFFWALVVTNF